LSYFSHNSPLFARGNFLPGRSFADFGPSPAVALQPRERDLYAISSLLPALPGMQGPRTYAPSPVWSGSTTKPVRFAPVRRKAAAKLYHQARAFERQTRQPGRQDGTLGRNGLAVLHALVFDCLNYASGQLDPSYETLARLACISVRSVARGLVALRDAGVLTWVRRCVESVRYGRFTLEQQSNAYGIVPASQWRGFATKPPAPPPEAGTWGDHPCGARDALTEAAAALAEGSDRASVIQQLEMDATNPLAAVLARLGRTMGLAGSANGAVETAAPLVFSRSASLTKNLPHSPIS
jgi:hypothetical protein